jgi:hypothetical protein
MKMDTGMWFTARQMEEPQAGMVAASGMQPCQQAMAGIHEMHGHHRQLRGTDLANDHKIGPAAEDARGDLFAFARLVGDKGWPMGDQGL